MNNLQEGQDLPETAYIILSAYIYIYIYMVFLSWGFMDFIPLNISDNPNLITTVLE